MIRCEFCHAYFTDEEYPEHRAEHTESLPDGQQQSVEDTSRFSWRLDELQWSQCVYCRHLGPGGTCPAFPVGIPEEINFNLHDHRLPYPDDGGLRMEPKMGFEGYEFRSWERFRSKLLDRQDTEPSTAPDPTA